MDKTPKPRLIRKNGRWYENGKYLSTKNYIFHADSHEGEYILSCITGQKYRLREAIYV